MSSPLIEIIDEDRLKLKECLEDDTDALTILRNKYQHFLKTVLMVRGASEIEAEDLLADLWGDCVAGADDTASLLEKYSGRCPLKNWLTTVATNRLFDLKRKLRVRGAASYEDDEGGRNDSSLRSLILAPLIREGVLVGLLRESLQHALDRCSASALLMLRLVYLHGLTLREVGRMWGWHESKVSRCLTQAMSEIQANTLKLIKQTDPWMELIWQDFLDLCETHQIGFI